MRFRAPEIARAKTMKAAGFPWRPSVGDWFVSHAGFCDLVRTLEEAERVGKNGHAFLPRFEDCRAWLGARGYTHFEMYEAPAEDDLLRLVATNEAGEVLRAAGTSDLDCMYQAVLRLLVRERSTP